MVMTFTFDSISEILLRALRTLIQGELWAADFNEHFEVPRMLLSATHCLGFDACIWLPCSLLLVKLALASCGRACTTAGACTGRWCATVPAADGLPPAACLGLPAVNESSYSLLSLVYCSYSFA